MRRYEAGGRNVLGHEPEPPPPFDAEASQFFDALRLRVSGMVDVDAFATWWRPASGWCWEDGGGVLVVALPSPQFVLWWRALYMGRLATAARECGREGLRFRLIVVDPEPGAKEHDGSVR